MKPLIAGVLLLLAACTPPDTGFRDGAAPIAAITRFEPERFAGRYAVLATFVSEGAQPEKRDIRFDWDGRGGFTLLDEAGATGPQAGGPGGGGADRRPFDLVGPGRLRPHGATRPQQELWVLWTDADYRTAAIGTPSGGYGMILERGDAAPDRAQAAREILEWYGYDLSRLVNTK